MFHASINGVPRSFVTWNCSLLLQLLLLFCYCRCDSPILLALFMLHTWWLLNQQRDYKLTCLGFVLEAGFPRSKIVRWVVERGRGSSTISALGRLYFFFFVVIAHLKSFHFDVGWSMWLSRCGGWKWCQPSFSLVTGGGHLLTVPMHFIAALELFLSFGFTQFWTLFCNNSWLWKFCRQKFGGLKYKTAFFASYNNYILGSTHIQWLL